MRIQYSSLLSHRESPESLAMLSAISTGEPCEMNTGAVESMNPRRIMKYRYRPVEVEAWPVNELLNMSLESMPVAIVGAVECGVIEFDKNVIRVMVVTGGTVALSAEDWIVIRPDGVIRPYRAERFQSDFEPID